MLYTVGHSNHTKEDFAKMIDSTGCRIIDTRSHPTSGMERWIGTEMQQWLSGRYEFNEGLGGWAARHELFDNSFIKSHVKIDEYTQGHFPKQRIAAKREIEGEGPEWTNLGLYDYSFYMMLPEFLTSADELTARCQTENLAILCCEAQWWRCHRSLIADYVVWRGIEVIHLMPKYRQKDKIKFVDGTRQIKHSEVIGDRIQRYDHEIIKSWTDWKNGGKQ